MSDLETIKAMFKRAGTSTEQDYNYETDGSYALYVRATLSDTWVVLNFTCDGVFVDVDVDR